MRLCRDVLLTVNCKLCQSCYEPCESKTTFHFPQQSKDSSAECRGHTYGCYSSAAKVYVLSQFSATRSKKYAVNNEWAELVRNFRVSVFCNATLSQSDKEPTSMHES